VNEIPVEAKRGCGYRQVGKLYLVGMGVPYSCDNMPYPLDECECCGYAPPFSRNLQWIKKTYIETHFHDEVVYDGPYYDSDVNKEVVRHECKCRDDCPICWPDSNNLKKYALMWVGEQHYTPEAFVLEANKMGVCKAIPNIPKDLKLGETWVFLAHRKVKFYEGFDECGLALSEPIEKAGIFYGFIPQRVELLIWKSEASEEKLEELKSKGITPIIVEDGDEAHK